MSQPDIAGLIEDNYQLAELQRHPGWAVLVRKTEEWQHAHEQRLLSGSISDLYEYKETAGRLDGVRQIMQLPAAVARELENAKKGNEEWVDEFAIPPEEYSRDTQETTVGG